MDVLFTLFYILFSICLIYPPTEFESAGLTIPQIFEKFLSSENNDFIQFHIKRTVLTLFIHSCLPLGYVLCLLLSDWSPDGAFFWQIFITVAVATPVVAVYKLLEWSRDGFRGHPIARNLAAFTNSDNDWLSVAANINTDFKRIDKISISTNITNKVIATSVWIIKVSTYNVQFAHQSDASLVVNNAVTHELSITGESGTQYLNIEVKSGRSQVNTFNIRLNALDFKELQEKVTNTITILPNVVFHTSILERFIEVFKELIANNSKFVVDQELELCIGCMQAPSNVKLNKQCADDPNQQSSHQCTNCYCRPLWCVDCMARWFASRQDANQTDQWLSSKCTCPVCRAVFCVLDVSYIEINQEAS